MCIVNTMTTWGSSRPGSKGRSLHVRCQHDDDVSFVPLCGVRCLQKVGSLRQEGDSPDRTSPLLVTSAPSSSSCRHSYAHHVIPASPHIILAFSHVIPAKAGIQPTASDAHSYAPAQGWTGARGVLSCETDLPSNGLSTQSLVVL